MQNFFDLVYVVLIYFLDIHAKFLEPLRSRVQHLNLLFMDYALGLRDNISIKQDTQTFYTKLLCVIAWIASLYNA